MQIAFHTICMCIVRTKGGGLWRSWGSGVLGIHWPAPTPRQPQLARVSELQSSRVPGDGDPWAARGGGAVVDYVVDNGRYAFYVTDCVYVSAGVLPGYYVNIYIMQQVEYIPIYTHSYTAHSSVQMHTGPRVLCARCRRV